MLNFLIWGCRVNLGIPEYFYGEKLPVAIHGMLGYSGVQFAAMAKGGDVGDVGPGWRRWPWVGLEGE